MNAAALWRFVLRNGLEIQETATVVVGLVFLVVASVLAQNLGKKYYRRKRVTLQEAWGVLSGLAIGLVCAFLVLSLVRKRYLLAGPLRYTVATVFKHGVRRNHRTYTYEYFVDGQRHQSGEDCQVRNRQEQPCPPVGTRYYVGYSVQDPETDSFTAVLVPDSVQNIPSEGWARLPQK